MRKSVVIRPQCTHYEITVIYVERQKSMSNLNFSYSYIILCPRDWVVFSDKSLATMYHGIYPASGWLSLYFYSYIATDLCLNNDLELCRLVLSENSVSVCATGLTALDASTSSSTHECHNLL